MDPAHVAPEYWRYLHNRLLVGGTAATVQQQASGLAEPANADAMSICCTTVTLTAAATAVTIGPKPAPRFVWNASAVCCRLFLYDAAFGPFH
jgi:hypothetical protein